MKSRRELLAELLIDLTKAIFTGSVIGVVFKGGLAAWPIALGGIILCAYITAVAIDIHPKAEIDKEKLRIWKQ